MKRLFCYLRPYLKQCIVGPLFKLLEAVLELTIPVLTAWIIDNGIAKNDPDYVIKTGLMMVCIVVVGLLSALVCQYSASVAAQGFGMKLRTAMFRKVTSLSYRNIDKLGASTLANRITNDVNQVQAGVNMFIRLAIRAPFICIGSAVCAMLLNPTLGAIILASLPIFSLIIWAIMKTGFPLYKKVQHGLDTLSQTVASSLSGVRVIRAFSRQKQEQDRFEQNNDDLTKSVIRVHRISTLTGPLTSLVMNGAVILILWFGAKRFVGIGDVTAGEIFAFVNYLTQMLAALVVFANLLTIFTKANASIHRVNEVMELTEEEDTGTVTQGADETDKLRFEAVTFGYSKTPVFRGVSFALKQGETLGIIGPTGSGKSTLANLIGRFYTPSEGAIFVDGTEVRDYSLAALREKIGFVAQRDTIFSGTIRDNIAFGTTPDDEQVRWAAAIAQADGFIEEKGGLDTVVERGGANFSGGQKQRLTVARAVYKKPEILILDDATSALDYLTESRLRHAVKEQLDCTLILISQRVSAVKSADKILVLDDSQAVGFGSHEELLASCEAYREIVSSQEKGGAAV